MSSLNEAYRVLSDPGRRAIYDRSLDGVAARGAAPGPTSDGSHGSHGSDGSGFDDDDAVVRAPGRHHDVLSPSGPARVPWKLMAVTAIVGSIAVLVGASFNDPPSEERPDGILRAGSCVEIESNGDAREIACTGVDDVVVELLIPTGATCPSGLVAHRDRLGLGTACIVVD